MFEQDKNILGQKANYDLGINQKEDELSRYEIDLYKLEVFIKDDILLIKEDDFDNLLKTSFPKNIKEGKFVEISQNMIDYILKNKSNVIIEYVKNR